MTMTADKPLPLGWKWARLGDVAEYINGRAFKPEDWQSSGTPIIRIQNLSDINAPFNYYDERVDERYNVNNGDLLISWSATLDAFMWNRGAAILNQHIFLVREFPERIRRDYLYFAVREAMTEIRSQVHGATMKHITKPEFENITIPLPPLAEQKRIAAILTDQLAAVDRARAAAEAQLQAAKALPAAFLSAVFDSLESQRWAKKPFGEIIKIIAPQVDPTKPEYGGLPHINGENIESGTGKLLWLNSASEDGMTSGKYLFDVGDVLYSKLRPYLRKVVLADCKGVCSADMYPIKVDRQLLDPQFTAWLLLSDQFTNYANEASARARMPKLNREQLFAWQSPVPPLVQQHQITTSLDQQIKAVQKAETAIKERFSAINELPDALLRQAFSGNL